MPAPIAACELVSHEGVSRVLERIRDAANELDLGERGVLLNCLLEEWEAKAERTKEWLEGKRSSPVLLPGEAVFPLVEIIRVRAMLETWRTETRVAIESRIYRWERAHG